MTTYQGHAANHPTAKLRQLYRRVKVLHLGRGVGVVLCAAAIGVLLGQLVR